uniref:Parkin coregulated gene protein n=1 Tax=Lygus hesperus TaxID=30085 RepID=A0A0A9ZIA6_LYGHE
MLEISRSELEMRMKKMNNKCYPDLDGVQPRVKKKPPPRVVPPFSIQSLQKNTIVAPLPKGKPPKPFPVGQSAFRNYYKRGDFPIGMDLDQNGYKIAWRVNVEDIDYHYYLPMFVEGLTETEHPYKFFSQYGIRDMVTMAPHKVVPVIPQIIIPIKNALNTHNNIVISTTLKVLQDLASSSEEVGRALVPYYRQILAPLNFMKDQNVAKFHEGGGDDDIDYGQQKRENVGDLVQETLEVLERFGGRDAFINIKYMIPTYESCVRF